jgi:hypothetical protein
MKVSRLFLRVNPADAAQRITIDAMTPMATDRTMLDRARKLFAEQVSQSYSLDLNDLSRENWNLVPPIGDMRLTPGRTPTHGSRTATFRKCRRPPRG